MLSSFRKFSNSIIAKVFLLIVAIPFIFWGMGDLFSGGNKNTIVKIGKEKIHTQEFARFLNSYSRSGNKLDKNLIEKLLSDFIGNKLISKEIEDSNIILSDYSLSKILKNDKSFQEDEVFSRLKYERFLVKNNLSAVGYEYNLSNQERRKQLLDLIGGGVVPPNFFINKDFDQINQKRLVQIINLNEIFKKENNFTENQIQNYFNNNKEKYMNTYRSINYIELTPKNLTENDEFNNLFFEKIDQIDDSIVEGKNLKFILKKYNLDKPSTLTIDLNGKNKKSEKVDYFSNKSIKNIFSIEQTSPTILSEDNGKYFVIELVKTESLQKTYSDPNTRENIIRKLSMQKKRRIISSLINEINKNNFKKIDFENFSKEKNLKIKKVEINNLNDNKILDGNLIKQIYTPNEKSVIIVTDIGLSKNYLVYIDKITNSSIAESSSDYEKYYNLSKVKIISSLYNTYDIYLGRKYNIDINYKALDEIKNNFR